MTVVRIFIYFFYALLTLTVSPLVFLALKLHGLRRHALRRLPSNPHLRIAYLSTDIWLGHALGGPASHKLGFCRGLLELGHTPAVFASQPIPTLKELLTNYHVVPAPTLPKGFPLTICVLANNVVFASRAYRLLKRFKPDVVCHRNSKQNLVGLILAWALGVPLIVEYNSPACWKLKSETKNHFLDLQLSRFFEHLNLLAADRILVVAEVLRDYLLTRGWSPAKVAVNPNGADTEQFRPDIDASYIRRRFDLEGKVVVGWAGTYGQWHGLDYLAKAARVISEQRSDVHFLFIGRQTMVDAISAIAEADHTKSLFTLLTDVPHLEMPSYYAACDILASPHVHMPDGGTFFGSPTKIFEYMAMGKPIIASGVGQIGEVLKGNALLVRPGDIHDLAEAIITLAADPELRQRLGNAGRQRCLYCYTWRHNADRFVRAYREAITTESMQ